MLHRLLDWTTPYMDVQSRDNVQRTVLKYYLPANVGERLANVMAVPSATDRGSLLWRKNEPLMFPKMIISRKCFKDLRSHRKVATRMYAFKPVGGRPLDFRIHSSASVTRRMRRAIALSRPTQAGLTVSGQCSAY